MNNLKTRLGPITTRGFTVEHSQAVCLLQFLFFCSFWSLCFSVACILLSGFVCFSFCCHWWAMLCDCGPSWTSSILFGPRHAKTCLRAYADSEGQDQTAHPRSLIYAMRIYYIMYE